MSRFLWSALLCFGLLLQLAAPAWMVPAHATTETVTATVSPVHEGHAHDTSDMDCTALCDVLCHCLSASALPVPVFAYWQVASRAHAPTALALTFDSAHIGMRYRPPIAFVA